MTCIPGINLNELRDYDPQMVFADAVLTARIDAPIGTQLPPTATSWPSSFRIYLARQLSSDALAGVWDIRITPASKGAAIKLAPVGCTFTLSGPANDPTGDVWYSLTVPAGQTQLVLDVSGGQVLMFNAYRPGVVGSALSTFRQQKFYQPFLAALAAFKGGCLRFMDWLGTNGSPVKQWSDAPTRTNISYASRGSYEDAIDLANQAGCHAWLNIPYLAGTDFAEQLAALVRDRLDPELDCYVEYTNEHWNTGGIFNTAAAWLQNQAKAAVAAGDTTLSLGGTDTNTYSWWHRFYAQQVAKIAQAWRKVDSHPRIKFVLGCQREDSATTTKMLQFLDKYWGGASKVIDVIAIAPYMGDSSSDAKLADLTADELFNGAKRPASGSTAAVTTTGLLDASRITSGASDNGHAAIAKQWGVGLAFYEFGIGLNAPPASAGVMAAHTDPRLGTVSQTYLAAAMQASPVLANWFNLATAWSQNPWGATDSSLHLNQPVYEQVSKWAQSLVEQASTVPVPKQALADAIAAGQKFVAQLQALQP